MALMHQLALLLVFISLAGCNMDKYPKGHAGEANVPERAANAHTPAPATNPDAPHSPARPVGE